MKISAEKDGGDIHFKLRRSMNFWSAFAKMYSPVGKSAYFLRNMDVLVSNFICRAALAYGFDQELSLANESLEKADLRNRIYLQALQQLKFSELSDLVINAIHSGGEKCIINTSDLVENNLNSLAENLADKIKKESANGLQIDDSAEFLNKALTAKQMVYVPDDNGEVVFDLALLQQLISRNPSLKIFIVVNKELVSNNINTELLEIILADKYFSNLSYKRITGNLQFLEMSSCLDVPTAADLPPNAQEIVKQSDLVMVKGQLFFEFCDMWRLNPNTYHFFISSSSGSNMLTGVNRWEAVVAHIPSAESKYVINGKREVIKTLSDLRAEENEANGKLKEGDMK